MVLPRIATSSSKEDHQVVEDVRVGTTKDALDSVGDHALQVSDVTACFGRFIKYYVRGSSTTIPQASPIVRNAFQIMMCARKQQNTVRLPSPVTVRNKRDQLYNDLLELIKSKELEWRAEEVHNGTATKAIQAIRDLLWYIDGSHATLSERGCGVPDLFQKFVGYNRPEEHKHRKRLTHSLSKEVLFSHSQCIFGILHGAFWDRPMWAEFKQSVETLARSISKYADLLITKRIRMEAIHSSPDVVRSIGDFLTVH